jgi:hypothetical protein
MGCRFMENVERRKVRRGEFMGGRFMEKLDLRKNQTPYTYCRFPSETVERKGVMRRMIDKARGKK